jgi:hypothetical protein
MLRALLLLSPWLLVGGCASVVTGWKRLPISVTIGYEMLFEDLWGPVAGAGLILALASLPLFVRARAIARAGSRVSLARTEVSLARTEVSLARTLTAIGPLVLVVAVIVLLKISSVAHTEAETRSHEAQAAFMADLHDYTPPLRSPVWFHEDWRKTAHLSRTLYLAAACCFAGWLLLRAWLVARADAVDTGPVRS